MRAQIKFIVTHSISSTRKITVQVENYKNNVTVCDSDASRTGACVARGRGGGGERFRSYLRSLLTMCGRLVDMPSYILPLLTKHWCPHRWSNVNNDTFLTRPTTRTLRSNRLRNLRAFTFPRMISPQRRNVVLPNDFIR